MLCFWNQSSGENLWYSNTQEKFFFFLIAIKNASVWLMAIKILIDPSELTD